jgi:hypothetical protein
MSNQPDLETVLYDLCGHKVEVLNSNGVYRHLRCSDGTFNLAFDVVTYPNHLCFSGDMGSFVFTRLPDMLNLFRSKLDSIDYGYLGGKLCAEDIHSGYERFCESTIKASLAEKLNEICTEIGEGYHCDIDRLPDDLTLEQFVVKVREEFNDYFSGQDLYESGYIEAIEGFVSELIPNLDLGHDWPEWMQTKGVSHRFYWACMAITWAVAQYDILTSEVVPEAPKVELKRYTSEQILAEEELYALADTFCSSGVPFEYVMTEGELQWLEFVKGKYSVYDYINERLVGNVLTLDDSEAMSQSLDDDNRGAGKAPCLSDDTALQKIIFWCYSETEEDYED